MENRIQIVEGRRHLFSMDGSIGITARIRGEITKEIVKESLAKVLLKYPIFASTIIREENGHVYYNPGSVKEVVPVYYPFAEMNHLDVYIQKEEETPYDFEHGPLFKLIIFKGENRCLAVLLGHPVVSDAKGYQRFIEEMVYFMNQTEEQPEPIAPCILGYGINLPIEASLGIKDKIVTSAVNKEWRKHSHLFSYIDYKELFERQRRKHKMPIVLKELNEKCTKTLLANCEEKKVSLTAAVTAAFLAVMHNFDRFHKEGTIHTFIMLDHRQKEMKESIADLSSEIEFLKEYSQGTSFWSNAKAVEGALKSKGKEHRRYKQLAMAKVLDPSLLESIPFAAYGGYEENASKKAADLFYKGEKDKGLGISNLGVVNYEKEQDYAIDSMNFIPPACLSNDLTVGSVVVNGHLMLAVRYDKVHYSERIIEDMVRSAINYMGNRT